MSPNESCPVCCSRNLCDVGFLSQQALGAFPIWECRDCSHRFITNAPSDQELKVYYDHCYLFGEQQKKPSAPGWRSRALARTLAGRLPRSARVLDIGANFGGTLLAFPDTYVLEGVELSGSAASIAARNPRLRIYNDFFDAIAPDLAENAYDCIIALAVIEHIRFPINFLAQIAKLLRPGGVAVLMTGDYATWNVGRLGTSWPLYHSDGHLHFFSGKSLNTACASVGLRVYSQIWAGPNSVTSRLPSPLGRAFHCQATTISFPFLFGRRPLGDLIYAWSYKDGTSQTDRQ